jgi:glycosyltransferase involved in cell wall biosynthesis
MRVLTYTKRLTRHLDEGIAAVAHEVTDQIAKHHEVLTMFSAGEVDENGALMRMPTNSSGLNLRIRTEIGRFRPDVILYIPRASACLSSFCFGRLLGWYARRAKVTILTVQPNQFAWLSKKCVPLLKPDLVLTASVKAQRELVDLGCEARFVPLGVDLEKFAPATQGRKLGLRDRYGFGREDYIVLHVGHITEGRNIRALQLIQATGNQVVIVGSTFFSHDAGLAHDLEAHGMTLLRGHFDHIEEIYQLADSYVFPTLSEMACISQPLSVLEAMACNLPVVSTRFGGLPDLFPKEDGGLLYGDTSLELASKIERVREDFRQISPRTREMVEQYSWIRSGQEILSQLERVHSASPAASQSTGETCSLRREPRWP